MGGCEVTVHAAARAVQRFGVSRAQAREFVRRNYERSVKLPRRYVRAWRVRLPVPRKSGVEFRVAGRTFMVCRGRTVFTVWPLDLDQLATVLTWTLTGFWLDGVNS